MLLTGLAFKILGYSHHSMSLSFCFSVVRGDGTHIPDRDRVQSYVSYQYMTILFHINDTTF